MKYKQRKLIKWVFAISMEILCKHSRRWAMCLKRLVNTSIIGLWWHCLWLQYIYLMLKQLRCSNFDYKHWINDWIENWIYICWGSTISLHRPNTMNLMANERTHTLNVLTEPLSERPINSYRMKFTHLISSILHAPSINSNKQVNRLSSA